MYSGTLILATSWIDPEFLWLFGVFLMCFVKYAVAAGMAIAHFENPIWGYVITTIGGIAAAFFWIFFGNWAQSKKRRTAIKTRDQSTMSLKLLFPDTSKSCKTRIIM